MGKQKLDLEMLSIVRDFIKSSGGQKFICGTYSNGKPRSVVDALRDEIISPKDRERWEKKKKQKRKNAKKKKKGKKQKNSDIFSRLG